MKKIICALSLLSGASYALSGTLINTYSGNNVQCNDWGWVRMYRTFWQDVVCSPLQVQTHAGDVLSVANTDVCNGGVAVYTYNEGDTEITFTGCS